MAIETSAALFAAMIIFIAAPGPGVFTCIAKALASGYRASILLVCGIVAGNILFFSSGYSWAESAVFDYDDFGPQVLAYQTIGYQWYQWNRTGGSDPNDIDPIKVVVYWDEPLGAIKNKYPVEPRKKKDYRYLSYDAAMQYLDSTLSEFPEYTNLAKTREKLVGLKKR